MRAASVASAIVLAAAVLGGCGSAVPSPATTVIAVPTQAPPPAGAQDACMMALLTGVIAADPRWGIVVAHPGGEPPTKVIWPHGYAGMADANGLALVDLSANGATIARVGDHVELGGGFLSGVDNAWFACDDIKVVPAT